MDIIGLIVAIVIAAIVIWIVGKIGLGMEVSGFGGAIIAAIVIGIVTWVINWLLFDVLKLTINPGLFGAIILIVVAAVVLLISGRFVSGLKVNGFLGAIVAAIAMGVVYWLLSLIGIG